MMEQPVELQAEDPGGGDVLQENDDEYDDAEAGDNVVPQEDDDEYGDAEAGDNVLQEDDGYDDEHYQPLLATLKRKQLEITNLHSLENCIVNFLCDNLDFYLTQEKPFHSLPGDVLNLLVDQTPGMQLWGPQEVPLVVTDRSRTLRVCCWESLHLWTQKDLEKLCDLIASTGCASLRTLVFDTWKRGRFLCLKSMGLSHLHSVFATAPNLTELQISECGATDETASILSSSCHQLKTLDVSFNPLTTAGVDALCQGCPKLEDLNVRGIEFLEPENISHVLSRLKSLQYLDHGKTWLGLKHYMEANGAPLPNFKGLLEFDEDCSSEEMARVHQTVPNLESIALQSPEGLTQFYVFQKINNLKLSYLANNYNFEGMRDLERDFSNKVTHLNILCCDMFFDTCVDLSLIGRFFPQLENFELYGATHPEECAYPLEDYHFARVRSLKLEFSINYETTALAPAPVLHQLLAGSRLASLEWNRQELEPGLLESLLADPAAFSALELFHVNARLISSDAAIRMVCQAPRLCDVSFHGMLEDHFTSFRGFVQRNIPKLFKVLLRKEQHGLANSG